MSTRPDFYEQQRRRIHSLIAAAAIAVIVICGIGIATLADLIPASKAPHGVTNAPVFIDTQSSDPLSGLKANVQADRGLTFGEHARESRAR